MAAPAHLVDRAYANAADGTRAVDHAAVALVDATMRANTPLALAVSGGADSMVLMHAVSRALTTVDRAVTDLATTRVLTFDHGTGAQAAAAADLVAREAASLGFDVRVGRGALRDATEAAWRSARWRFLRAAAPPGAVIATAHTRDDHLETVVMRVMRGAGARGLAGLAAPADGVARPFLNCSRDDLRRYGNARQVAFVEDPSNTSRRHLRNRIRHDLLPAIVEVSPRFAAEMLRLSERAAAWRADVDALALRFVMGEADDGAIRVAREELATYDSATLCVLWPAIAARARVTLDRRGTLRLAQFTTSGAPGARMQLSGGVEVYRHRDSFVVRRGAMSPPAIGDAPLAGTLQLGEWRFRPVTEREHHDDPPSAETAEEGQCVQRENLWVADLPVGPSLSVRAWRPADRMRARADGPARRVKRFFGDAQVPGPRRAGWPVVLVDGEIVWIPGIRRSSAAAERSGRPVVRYVCERNQGGFPSS
jgi:tRNA(Ile)-lysidine synthase